MSEHQPILPALKPYSWPAHPYALCRPVFAARDLPAIPWVGYGYHHAESFEFLSRETFPSGSPEGHIPLIEQAALRNLRQRPLNWKIETVWLGRFLLGRSLRMKLLIGSDDYLASEHILDPHSMQYAAQQLKARRIAVGVPCRGVLVATNARQHRRLLSYFSAMVSEQYYNARTAPISPIVFLVEQGQIIGALTGLEEAGKSFSPEPGQVNLPTSPSDVYLNAVISADRQTGVETLHLLAGGTDFDILEQALLPAFARGLEQMLTRPDFNGQVRIILVPSLIPRTPDLPDYQRRLQERLRAAASKAQYTTQSGRPIEVRVMVGMEADSPVDRPLPGTISHLLEMLREMSSDPASQQRVHQALRALSEQVDGKELDPAQTHFLASALSEILAGRPGSEPAENRVLAAQALSILAQSAKGSTHAALPDQIMANALIAALFDPEEAVQAAAERGLLELGLAASKPLRSARRKLDKRTNPETHRRLSQIIKQIEAKEENV